MENKQESGEDKPYGIDKDFAHPKAVELIPEEFFWDCVDEAAPFGSDEGDTALGEYRDWRQNNPNQSLLECLIWVIEDVGEMDFQKYNSKMLNRKKIAAQIDDDDFDDQQFIYTLDLSVITTGFGQLVDEGTIDAEAIPVVELAIDRQLIWSELVEWEEYHTNLKVLKDKLQKI
ncbi:hypothetical protein Q0590_37170 [Rhodocytophaga aerolata]|uniref:Uncharacterized protein n=1 Tax=Rhodocytophaga aerolata TaxID=455078 RepID=A0ABT8RL16_9BACT|nr:hypothetical protein [Rhodocytophaga aerolata]MDO1451960.1 hypothetical protein [Rhodocytophaga aerolata]